MSRLVRLAIQLVLLLGLACVGVASAVLIRNADAAPIGLVSVLDDAVAAKSVAQAQGGTAPDAVVWRESVDTAPLSITTTMQLSEEAVEAVVVGVSPAFFNTPSGGPPTSPGPISDDDDVDAEWSLWRTVTLQVTARYKGDTSNTHVVTSGRGGTYDANADDLADYVHEAGSLDLEDAAIGDEYFLYGLYPFVDPPQQAVGWPWEERALDIAIDMTSNNVPTLFIETYAAYKVDGNTATSKTNHAEVGVGWLRQMTQSLAGP